MATTNEKTLMFLIPMRKWNVLIAKRVVSNTFVFEETCEERKNHVLAICTEQTAKAARIYASDLLAVSGKEAARQLMRRKVELQMFDIFGFGNTHQLIDDALTAFKKTNTSVTDVCDNINGFVSKFMDITSLSNDWINKLSGVVLALLLAKPGDRIKALITSVVSVAGAQILKYLWEIVPKHMLQSGFEEMLLPSLLALLIHSVIGLPKDFAPETLLKFFSERGRQVKFSLDGFKSMKDMLDVVIEYVRVNVFGGLPTASELDTMCSGYDKWTDAVKRVILGHTTPLITRLETDEKLWFEIDTLYTTGLEIARDFTTKKIPQQFNVEFQKVFKIIEDAKRQCDSTGVFGNKPRVEPLVIHLFGESGVGKSGMSWPLATDINSVFCSLEDAQDFAKNIYFRNTEQEFWDGYAGQNVVCYDDFAQRVDASSSPNEEFMELIRASNMAPYPLHMADIVEKRRTKFISKAIILTSNKLEQQVNSLTFPDAYRRRIDICGKVQVKPEYTKLGNSLATGETVERLDPNKTSGPVDTQVYEIVLYNAETANAMCDNNGNTIKLDYDAFVMKCCSLLKTKIARGININKALAERITKERHDRLVKATLQMSFEPMYELIKAKYDAFEFPTESIWKFVDEVKDRIKAHKVFLACLSGVFSLLAFGWSLWPKTKTCVRHKLATKACHACHEITKSGDNCTNKTVKVNESTHSGDNLTHKIVRVQEISHSGDALTNKASKVVEMTHSGDNITQRRITNVEHSLTSRKEDIAHDMQAWEDSVAQDLISSRIMSNLYKVVRIRDGHETPCLNGLFVRDTVMLLPYHIMSQLAESDTIRIENIFGSIFTLPLKEIKRQVITGRDNTYKDAMLWQFPRYVNAHSDLVKHFQKMPELASMRANVCLPTLRSNNGKNIMYIHGNTQAQIESVTLSTSTGEYHIRDSISYRANTTFGDCGAPVICNETRVLRKICGIHIAGETSGAMAYAQSVTQNDLLVHLMQFDTIITDPDQMANISVKSAEHQSFNFGVEYTQEEVKSKLGLAANTFFYIGKCLRSVFVPSKTELRKSVIHGLVTPATSKPAVLFDKTTNIMQKNLAKSGENTPYIEKAEIEQAVNSYKTKILSDKKQHLCRVLTTEEAISGSTDSEFMNGLSRKSSPGYPWVFDKASGKPGKTTWFGSDDKYVITPEIINRISHLEDIAADKKRIPFIWTDTLKDERRPIEKVDALKTRVFAAGPMDYTILVRKYFLGFIANTMENRIENEQSLGTNPFGTDWALTARRLNKYGKKVFAGDFSTFDGTLNANIMHSFVEAVNEWYNDGKRNAAIRETLFLDVMNSVHLCGDVFYGTTHSQPSGNPLTTILNSWYNSVSMRIAYARCAKMANVKPPRFNDVVNMVSYGDDNVINFSDSIVDWFNQITVSEAYATFGMTYTDEAKTGNIQAYKSLEEVAYLKRGFRFANGYVYAPLDLQVCLEMCNWVRDSSDPEFQCASNIDVAARELAQHGEKVFRTWVPKLVSAFVQVTNQYPAIGTYSQYLEEN